MANNKSTFARNLKAARKAKGWSQQGAAAEIGISRATFAAYEEGRAECSLSTLLKICAIFNVPDVRSFLEIPKILSNDQA